MRLLVDVAARVLDLLSPVPVIGDKEEARGVDVQTADGEEARGQLELVGVALFPVIQPRLKEVDDEATRARVFLGSLSFDR